jgi:predicted ATPase
VSTEGDSFFAVFPLAADAVACAVAVQRSLEAETWPSGVAVRVRIGLHTGEGKTRANGYVGIDVHRAARISNCGHGGQILLSAPTAVLAERTLPPGIRLTDLGRHELRDLAYPEHLHQVDVEGLPVEFPPLRTSSAVRTNLPKRDTSFIGRSEETQVLAAAVQAHRLVTLAGTAGVGKTSLAIHAGSRLQAQFPDGVWLVGIASLTDSSQIASAVARELNIIEPTVEPVGHSLAGRLSHARLLLVLDGCEHMVADVAAFAEGLLSSTADVHLLVTTREPLSLSVEHLIRLAPLATPPMALGNGNGLLDFDAVALFVERARQVRPNYQVEMDDAQAVADISRRLGGIPLAIELAAARLKLLSVRQVAERLDHEFATLTSDRRDARSHHRTLKATLDWSYDFLNPAEQLLLARLSVFAGGFTLEAVEETCCGGAVEPDGVVELLGRLVDTSLVLVAGSDPVRYRLLEPVARYARARLAEIDDPTAVRRLHAAYYLRLGEQLEGRVLGREQLASMQHFDQERLNLHGALEWMYEVGDAQGVLRMATALRLHWMLRRTVAEGMKWLDRALADRGGSPPTTLVRTLSGAALLGIRRMDFERSERRLEEALQLARDLGDRRAEAAQLCGLAVLAWFREGDDSRADALAAQVQPGVADWWTMAWALSLRGTLARVRGDHTAAEGFMEEAHGILQERGGCIDLGWSHLWFGALAKDQGRYAEAARQLQEGRILLARVGDSIGLAHADAGLGALAWLRGDRDVAMSLYRSVLAGFGRAEEIADNLFELRTMLQGSVSIAQLRQVAQWNQERAQLGDRGAQAALAEHLFHLGKTAFRRSELVRAREALAESLLLCTEAADYRGAVIALIALGRVEAAGGNLMEAARFLGSAAALAEEDGFRPWPPLDEPDFEEHVAGVREALPAEEFKAAWDQGSAVEPVEWLRVLGVRPL